MIPVGVALVLADLFGPGLFLAALGLIWLASEYFPWPTKKVDPVSNKSKSGGDGIQRVKPVDPAGTSERHCIGGFHTRASDESDVVAWVKSLRASIHARHSATFYRHNLTFIGAPLSDGDR
jgi:hypothetical protein